MSADTAAPRAPERAPGDASTCGAASTSRSRPMTSDAVARVRAEGDSRSQRLGCVGRGMPVRPARVPERDQHEHETQRAADPIGARNCGRPPTLARGKPLVMRPFLCQRTRATLIVVLALALFPACATRRWHTATLEGERIVNLSTIESQIEAYHDSGRWAIEQAAVAEMARVALDERVPGVAKPAIVFDIDDTVLSNYPVRKDATFGFVQARWT